MADEILSHGITREAGLSNALLRGMARHPELCFVLLTVVFTFLSNYGTSFKSKPLVVPAKQPQPLFPAGSPVVDMYLGDLHPVVAMLNHEDLVFVMYYAPWCAKSQAVVAQFHAAAQFMQGKVQFAAVNCWYPEGMCRKQYKFLLFPVFFAYHHNNDGYRYLGIERAEFMVKFLEDLLNPLTMLKSDDDVKDFIVHYDTVVVGYFDFNSSPQPPGFQQFFYAALRVVEHDPSQPVKFGVITDADLARNWNLTEPSDIIFLRINNSTLKFSLPYNMTSSNITSWVYQNRFELPVRWARPLGLKSLTLSREVEKGPAVIMFHKVTPLASVSQSYSVFKDLALHYHQCPGDERAEDASKRWHTLSMHQLVEHAKVLNTCKDLRKKGLRAFSRFTCCISTITEHLGHLPEPTLNMCEVCSHKPNFQKHSFTACHFSKSTRKDSVFGVVTPPSNSCSDLIDSYDGMSHTSICCKKCSKDISDRDFSEVPFSGDHLFEGDSSGRRPTDRYVIEALEKLPRKLCDRMKFEKRQGVFPSTVIPDFGSSSYPENFVGFGCRSNRSLHFVTLDSQNHWMFAESLGLDVSHAHQKPVIVALDTEREEQHVLRETFTKKSTASFILNFTRGMLERNLRTIPPLGDTERPTRETVDVQELDTYTFRAAIEQPKDLVLMVYARWCGFCMAVTHTFLHLAHYFSTSTDIAFARINGENSDVPWEFTMESYPTIIFFPAHRKADSVAFPYSLHPTLPNLIRFVLQHSTITTRLHLAAGVCSVRCIHDNLDLSRRTLHSLKSKLSRLQLRLQNLDDSSQFQQTRRQFLNRQISHLRVEIDRVQTLKKYLEENRGTQIDRWKLQQLLQVGTTGEYSKFETGKR